MRLFYELIDSPASEPSEDAKPPLVLSTARIEFRDVHFAYRPGEPVINGMSFAAEPGRVTALVGPSGERQVDGAEPDPALLRDRARRDH